MVATSQIILPYEPGYVGNKEADKRRKETKERLRQRERGFAKRQQPPLIVPERLRAASVGGFVSVEVSKSARTAQASVFSTGSEQYKRGCERYCSDSARTKA
jgi:hypothetical protein